MLEVIVEIIGGIATSEEFAEIATFIFNTIKSVKGWIDESSKEDIQAVYNDIASVVNQHLVNQQRTNELLEMLLFSFVIFITFYVLRNSLRKGVLE